MQVLSKKQVGISIHENTLLVCEMRNNHDDTTEILNLNIVPIPKGIIKRGRILKKNTLKKLIKNALKTAFPSSIGPCEVIFEVPDAYCFQHSTILPMNLSEDQISKAIIFETEKLLPFDIEEVSWDYRIMPYNENNNLILFTAAPLDLIQEYYDCLISSGLVPLWFSIRTENMVLSLGRKWAKKTILIDLQRKSTNILFFEGQKILNFDQINIGENDLKNSIRQKFDLPKKHLKERIKSLEQEDIDLATIDLMEKIYEEFERIIKDFEQQEIRLVPKHEKPIDKLKKSSVKTKEKSKEEVIKDNLKENILEQEKKLKYDFLYTGDKIFAQTFREFFREKSHQHLQPLITNTREVMGLMTREQNQLSIVAKRDKKNKLKKLLPSCIGAALGHKNIGNKNHRPTNLLPPLVRSIVLWQKTSIWFHILAWIILTFSIGWIVIFGIIWGNTRRQLRIAESSLAMIEENLKQKKTLSIEEQIKTANFELQILNELQKSKIEHEPILRTIEEALPKGVVFSSFEFGHLKDKNKFEWKGIAKNRDEVIASHEAIKKLDIMDTVNFPPENLDDKDVFEFTILFTLKP